MCRALLFSAAVLVGFACAHVPPKRACGGPRPATFEDPSCCGFGERYYFDGKACIGEVPTPASGNCGCHCTGDGCADYFGSLIECDAAYRQCQ